jgi:hypothetical protein
MEMNVTALDYSVTSQATGCVALGWFLVTMSLNKRKWRIFD